MTDLGRGDGSFRTNEIRDPPKWFDMRIAPDAGIGVGAAPAWLDAQNLGEDRAEAGNGILAEMHKMPIRTHAVRRGPIHLHR